MIEYLRKIEIETQKIKVEQPITNILKDGELQADSVIREIRTTATDN